MLKLMKSKRKNKGDSPWGNRSSPSPQTGIKSPPFHVLGDYIVTPPKQGSTCWHSSNSAVNNNSLLSTPSPYKDLNGNSCSDVLPVCDSSFRQLDEQACKEKTQFVKVDKDKVNSHDKLGALAEIYSRCITGELKSSEQLMVHSQCCSIVNSTILRGSVFHFNKHV